MKTQKKNKTKNIIGVFDSGLGGLTVLKHFLKVLPDYNYIYLGDNARVPYGEKSPEIIYEYSRQAMEFLLQQGCNMVIVACNTSSAQALPKLQQEYLIKNYPDRKILGVVRPLAEFAAESKKNIVGIIGTRSTVNSKAYENEIKKLNKETKIQATASPLLVPLIEEAWAKKPETKMILKKYLRPLKAGKIKLLILACTHYPFLLKDIRRICGKNILVPDPGEIVAQSLKTYLNNHPELELSPSKSPTRVFYSTDKNGLFKQLAEKFLGEKMAEFKKAEIDEL